MSRRAAAWMAWSLWSLSLALTAFPIGWLMRWDRSEGKDEVAFTKISGRRTLVTLFVTFGRRLAHKIVASS